MPTYRSHTDEQLVSLLQQGSDEAFEEIYNRHWLAIYRRFFKKLQSKPLAEEYTQELFTSLWVRRRDITIHNSLTNYFNGAVRKMAINYIRSEIRKKLMQQDTQPESIESSGDDHDLYADLHDALNALPDKTGAIIKLSKLEGLTVKEIATHHNISNKAVEYHITRALKMLRVYLNKVRNAAAALIL